VLTEQHPHSDPFLLRGRGLGYWGKDFFFNLGPRCASLGISVNAACWDLVLVFFVGGLTVRDGNRPPLSDVAAFFGC